MRESKIENEVCKHAKKLGWKCYKFSSPGNKAVPDRIFLRNNKIIFIEFKATGKKPTNLQQKIIKRIKNEGFEVFVVDNIEFGKKVII